MKNLSIKFIIILTCEILIWRRRTFADVCDTSMYTGFLMANCTASELKDVPQDLDYNIEFLFLANNTFVQLDETSFARYTNLIFLSLQNTEYLNQSDPINYYTFQPLKKLELLILNEIATPFNLSFYWPPSLRLISVNYNNYIEEIDFSDLKSIQDVHAVAATLRDFPKFHVSSPLKFVDLRRNPMDSLTAEDLAPFCSLDFLSLEWPENAVINGSDRFCQCQRLENWIHQFKIGTNGPLNCTPPDDPDAKPCGLEYSEETLKKRRECVGQSVKYSMSIWFWVILGVIMCAPLIIVTFRETRVRRMNLRPSSNPRKSGSFPNVELMIDVDEDLLHEDEQEIDLFDASRPKPNLSKIDKKVFSPVKKQKDLKGSNWRQRSKSNHRVDEEEKEDEEEEAEEEEDIRNKIQKLNSPPKPIATGTRRVMLQVNPHEDFEDQFDVELPRFIDEQSPEQPISSPRIRPSKKLRIRSPAKIPKNFGNRLNVESPKVPKEIDHEEEAADFYAEKSFVDENKISPISKPYENFEIESNSKISKEDEHKLRPYDTKIFKRDSEASCENLNENVNVEEQSSKIGEQSTPIKYKVDDTLDNSKTSDTAKILSPTDH